MNRILVIFFSVVVGVFNDTITERFPDLLGYHRECVQELGVADFAFEEAFARRVNDDLLIKRQLACVGKKIGLINETGEIQTDDVRTFLLRTNNDNDEVERIVAKCTAFTSETDTETAFVLINCINGERAMYK
uniref:Odorant binding protein 27 n=1 Tax=Cylas formicarius TaxID=197179 RepID=A0A8T9EFT5_CYLFO|nr:odorant binding protein 27 [Cylas formicarius]UZC53364.1 odorant binding protein 36 [Cylas formicarius]